MPTLSEATNLVYKRRYNGEDSAENFLIAMKYNIKAIGNLPVNKITKQHIKKLMDYHRFTRKNSKQVTNTKVGYLKTVLDEMIEDGFIQDVSFPKRLKYWTKSYMNKIKPVKNSMENLDKYWQSFLYIVNIQLVKIDWI